MARLLSFISCPVRVSLPSARDSVGLVPGPSWVLMALCIICEVRVVVPAVCVAIVDADHGRVGRRHHQVVEVISCNIAT